MTPLIRRVVCLSRASSAIIGVASYSIVLVADRCGSVAAGRRLGPDHGCAGRRS